MCLWFGLWSMPKLNILTDLLSWIVEAKKVSLILHYLDDFFIMAPPSFDIYLNYLNTVK